MSKKYIFTSESVTEGHPDKMCDQISDSILDAIFEKDPNARVACETLTTTGLVTVVGEITTNAYIDIPATVRRAVKDIGYTSSQMGFDYKTCAVLVSIDEQSPDIAQGVNENDGLFCDQGAGDQGLMFGYATNETEAYMPLAIDLSHKLCKRLADVRRSSKIKYLRPDGKAQVSVEYVDNKPVRIDSVVVSTQHDEEVNYETIKMDIMDKVIMPVCKDLVDENTKYFINPTGRFVIGGPQGDAGLTGRKIIVDTYGGFGRHGGGAFSGKDPSKVDRSAAYMARYIAKNIVGSELAERAEVQLAYAIGVAEPVSVMVDTFGTGKYDDEEIAKAVRKIFPLKPKDIISHLDLRRPIYKKTAAYGHFGRCEPEFTWEKIDKSEELQKFFK
ncbi:MAG: methionine adenosyltransferase [Candidatus Muiribacteriota bacterium]|jgi:S-adenosylmethionine synthetase